MSKSRRTDQRFETTQVLVCGAGSIALRNVIADPGFVAIRFGLETEHDADALLFSRSNADFQKVEKYPGRPFG